MRRIAATRADGWNAWGASPDELAQEADELRAEAGRNLTVTWGGGVILAPDQGSAGRRRRRQRRDRGDRRVRA